MSLTFASRAAASRRGVTLIEVLISAFVVAIGLLSLASLLPVGKKLLADAGRNDRSVTGGLSGVAEVAARQIGDPFSWSPPYANAATTWSQNQTVCVDPQGFALGLTEFPSLAWATGPGAEPRMPRLSLNIGGATISPALAERLFTFQDDLIFTNVTAGQDRPKLSVAAKGPDNKWGVAGVDDDGNGTTDDESEAGWPGSDDLVLAEGAYSYLATLTPQYAVSETSPLVRSTSMGMPVYDSYPLFRPTGALTLDVVVFQRRSKIVDPAKVSPERICYADLLDDRGQFVRLRTKIADFPAANKEEYLKVKAGQWILLCANRPPLTLPSGATTAQPPLFRWHRVVGRGEIIRVPAASTNLQTDVMLAGPDVGYRNYTATPPAAGSIGAYSAPDATNPYAIVDADGDNSTGVDGGMTLFAVIVDDVIGVFQKTIEREHISLWQQ